MFGINYFSKMPMKLLTLHDQKYMELNPKPSLHQSLRYFDDIINK
jgi:hypothetical protein